MHSTAIGMIASHGTDSLFTRPRVGEAYSRS